jgi:hypothetical protein
MIKLLILHFLITLFVSISVVVIHLIILDAALYSSGSNIFRGPILFRYYDKKNFLFFDLSLGHNGNSYFFIIRLRYWNGEIGEGEGGRNVLRVSIFWSSTPVLSSPLLPSKH